MGINSYISKQFSNPDGLGGSLISFVMNRQNRPLYDETIRLLLLTESDSVLDIGCGNGFVVRLLAQKCDADFKGIDTSGSAIKSSIRRNRQFVRRGKMDFSIQNASSMSFQDGAFSKAYTINTVYFWDDLDKTMAEISRVLKPGGIFINTLYSNETLSRFSHTQFGYKRYSERELTAAGENAGFAVRIEPILRGAAYCVIYMKKNRRN